MPPSGGRPIHSVSFDLDGTLVDTIADLAVACDAMLADLARPPLGAARVQRLVGRGMAVLVERCLSEVDGRAPAPALLDRAITVFRQRYAECNGRHARIYPGVIEGLAALRAQGLPLVVVTNKPAAFTGPLLTTLGLADFFLLQVSGDTTAEKKPHPLPILHACQWLGVAPARNLHVGDSDNDLLAARAAGCLAWAVPYGYTETGAVDTALADALVSSVLEVASLVAAHNRAASPQNQ